MKPFKIPESVLVVIYTPALDVLLIERADAENFWQSVTGSKDRADEPLLETAVREVVGKMKMDAALADVAAYRHELALKSLKG